MLKKQNVRTGFITRGNSILPTRNMRIFFLTIASFAIYCTALAQKNPNPSFTRCATMLRVEHFSQLDRAKRAPSRKKTDSLSIGPDRSGFRLPGIVTIPIVVHIVLPNPYLVTDADVQAQIDRLNTDFSGLNIDSSNAPSSFLNVRGHSLIRFCLAKRTPNGQLTSGIERRASTVGSNYMDKDPIKFTALGGLDQWDVNSYLNLWVGSDASGGDILGYSTFPGALDNNSNEDGVFINHQSWAANNCYTLPDYRKGRTATHEIGHYFGLLHIWGDDDGCIGDDFENLTEVRSSCSLPMGLFNPVGMGNTASDIGDTPNQAGQTNSCPTGTVTDACATTAPGKMYQNFMDYTPDVCLSMFTQKQVERMEWVIDNCRASLKTSAGCQAPVNSISVDAAPLQSVNPGGVELTGCSTRSYSSVVLCAGSFAPKVRVINNGSQLLTSVTVGYRIDNGPVVTQAASVTLPFGGTAVVSFPSISIAAGTHQLKFFTTNPDGKNDQVPSNDTLRTDFSVNGTASLPFYENFTGTVFPPSNWSVVNPDNTITWQRSALGNGNTGSAFMNSFNYSRNKEIDDLITPRINLTAGIDSVKITFDIAAAAYSNPNDGSIDIDTLEILVSNDCGNTFSSVYKKWGNALITVATPQTQEFFPTTSQWRKDTVNLSSFFRQGPMQLFFRFTNNYENNVFIDNINIDANEIPASLKVKGHLVLPNPFHESFAIWIYKHPSILHSIKVYNSIGQLVWSKSFNGTTDTYFPINLFGKASGIYIVQVEYQDRTKNFSEQVIKW